MLMVIKNNIKDVSKTAHLWPPGFNGRSSCWVKRLINHPCKVSTRLFSHREVGVG